MAKRTNAGGVTKGSWTELEDNVLRKEVRLRGDDELCNGWAEIAEKIPGRTAKQCRERWVQNLKPSLDRGPITAIEADFILKQVGSRGTKWAEIARLLRDEGISHRSDNAVKNWYNGNKNRQKRALRRGGRDTYDASSSSHAALHRQGRRSSINMSVAANTTTANTTSASSSSDYSPMPSPSTPYNTHYSYPSRPTSQQSSGQGHHHYPQQQQHHHRHQSFSQFSPRQVSSQLPLLGSQLPLPLPTVGNSRYYDERRSHDERRGSVFTVAASPASDAAMPPLEADTGSPLIATSLHSPALSQAAGPQTYSLGAYPGYSGYSGYNSCHHDDVAQPMARTLSQISSQSQQQREYNVAMEPPFTAPAPPGSERLAISNLII